MELNLQQPTPATAQTMSSQTTRAWGIAAAAMLVIALVLVFLVAPRAQDTAGGDVQRIFYFHVSSAWNGFGAWFVTAIAGVLYLKRRDLKYDRVAVAAAEIGVLFITMVLLTGMLWARPVWNTWWTWDFKLTLSALQFLMYVAYLMLRTGIDDPNRRARFAAVYGIIGALTIPLNFLVSRVLDSIHPAVFGPSVNATQQGGFGITPGMGLVLGFCVLAFTVLFIFMLRVRIGIQERTDTLAARRAELTY
jgi:heme exporter protein C